MEEASKVALNSMADLQVDRLAMGYSDAMSQLLTVVSSLRCLGQIHADNLI